MDALPAERLEQGVDLAAAAIFAAAAAYAAFLIGRSPPIAAATAAVGLLAGTWTLRAVKPGRPGFALAQFEPSGLPSAATDEWLLTDADRISPPVTSESDELLLDDVLARLEDFSRVVRLFDPAAMPSAGELKTRVDRHLANRAPPDASQALHDALADLRQTLR